MSGIADSRSRLDTLLADWEEDRLTSRETEALTVCLEADPAARRVLVHHALLSAGIARNLSSEIVGLDRRVAARPGGWSGARAWMSLAAAALLALGLWAIRPNRGSVMGPGPVAAADPAALVEWAEGAVLVRGSAETALRAGQMLQAGDRFRTAEGGGIRVKYGGEETVIAIQEKTEAVMAGGGSGKRLQLASGRLEATVAPQPAGRPLVIASALAMATVRGTRFALAAGETAAHLEVMEGTVEFTGNRAVRSVLVAAGERAVAERDSGAVMRHGAVLFSQEFDQGFDDYDVFLEGTDGRRQPGDAASRRRVRIVESRREGRKVNCLEINSVGLGKGKYLLVAPRTHFEVADMAMACDYMGTEPRGEENRINVGLEIRGGRGSFDLSPVGPQRSFPEKTWIPWTSFYRVSRGEDGRQILESRNDMYGQPLSKGRSVFDAGKEPTGFLLNLSVTGMKVLVDRVEVRRMEYVPGAPEPGIVGGPSIFQIETAVSATVMRGKESLEAGKGQVLHVGDRLRTARGGTAVLSRTGGQARLELGETGELAVAGVRAVDVEAGRLAGTVSIQTEAEALIIRMPQATATPWNARFTLAVDAARSRLDVTGGGVRLAGLRVNRPVGVKSGEFALVETDSGDVMRFGPVLFRDDFEQGLDAYDVAVEYGKDRRVPADETTRKRVRLVDVKRGDRTVRCLEMDANDLGGYLDVILKKPFSLDASGLALWSEYTAMRPIGNKSEIDVGFWSGGEPGTFDVVPVGQKVTFDEGTWIDWFGGYWLDRTADGRVTIRSWNQMQGRLAFRGNAVYQAAGPKGLYLRFSAVRTKAVVDHIEVREMEYIPAGGATEATRKTGLRNQ